MEGWTLQCVDCPLRGILPAPTELLHGSSIAPAGSTACTCNAGYTATAGGGCTVTPCPAGTWSSVPGIPCNSCPSNSSSPPGSDEQADCLCIAGSSGPSGGPCQQCQAGTFTATIGAAACAACGAGTFSTAGSSVCAQCGDGTYSYSASALCLACPSDSNSPSRSISLANCICNVGFEGPDGGSCLACVPGKYKAQNGSVVCSTCPNGTFSSTSAASSAATCQSCPADTVTVISPASVLSDCVCTVGFEGPAGGSCTLCGEGTYKDTNSTDLCTQCQPGRKVPKVGLVLQLQ